MTTTLSIISLTEAFIFSRNAAISGGIVYYFLLKAQMMVKPLVFLDLAGPPTSPREEAEPPSSVVLPILPKGGVKVLNSGAALRALVKESTRSSLRSPRR